MCAFEEVTNAPEPAEYRPTTPMPTNFSTTPINTYEREGGVGEIDGILLGGDRLFIYLYYFVCVNAYLI